MAFVRVLVVGCLGLAGACTFPPVPLLDEDASTVDGPSPDGPVVDAPESTYTIGGSVAGLWSGATVVLELDASPAVPERFAVDGNGAFTFPTGLPAGRSFTLGIAANGQPFMHTCVVETPSGMVVDANVTNLQVTCTPQVSMDIAFTAPLDVDFDVAAVGYTGEAAHGVQETRLVVTLPGGASATVNGLPVTSGQPSAVVSLATSITVHVSLGAIAQDFTFTYERSGANFAGPLYAKASNTGPMDRHGPVSASGNLVAVGAPYEDGVNDASTDSGAVYIYRRVGLAWTQEAYLKPTVLQAGARFGTSVSLKNEGSTSVLAVGAPYHDGAGIDSGAVYVFRRSGAGAWTEEQRLEAIGAAAGDQFGDAVSLNDHPGLGYALAIGAPRRGTDHGAAYVFRNSGPLWSQEALVTSPNVDADDLFGSQVAIHDDSLVVTAPFEDAAGTGVSPSASQDNAASGSGAVYIYRRNGSDWSFEAYVKASNTDAGDQFGAAVAVEGDVLVIGAPREDSNGTSQANNNLQDSGAVYVFERSGGTWSQMNYLKSGVSISGMMFGQAVDVHGDLIVVGAPELAGAQGSTGAVRYFMRKGAGLWSGSALLRGGNSDEQDEYGAFVSLSGEGIFVGAPGEDSNATGFNSGLSDNTATDSGALYGHY